MNIHIIYFKSDFYLNVETTLETCDNENDHHSSLLDKDDKYMLNPKNTMQKKENYVRKHLIHKMPLTDFTSLCVVAQMIQVRFGLNSIYLIFQ